MKKGVFSINFINNNNNNNTNNNNIKVKRAIGQHYPGENLNPLNDISNVSSVDIYPTLESVNKKVDDLAKLWSKGEMEQSLVRYIPGLTKPIIYRYENAPIFIKITHKRLY